jgi:FkbM family methyltransferase
MLKALKRLGRRSVGEYDMGAHSMSDVLAQLARTTEVKTVVDVGASNGGWTRTAQEHLNADRYLLIEAQAAVYEQALHAFASADSRVEYVIAAAGDREGQIHFNAEDPLGGVASETPTGRYDITVPVTTIDRQVRERQLSGPFLIKLDTHGYEIPILTGAGDTLPDASALIIEAYNFQLLNDSLRFHELCSWLDERGFRCIDMCDVLWRADGALWQMDLVFVPASRSEFESAAFSLEP